ncbi:MAG: hypothetical protein ABT05_03260 [Lautropia sp. SCN 66-9]|nr:MAG: hypothetical protein ABT05_03260 [Lautropia sp. SCN 66-9]
MHHVGVAAAGGTKVASLLARLMAAWRQRREDAAFEQALRRDPRLMHDLRMARTRAEWRQ